jgi:hypothetical protein
MLFQDRGVRVDVITQKQMSARQLPIGKALYRAARRVRM